MAIRTILITSVGSLVGHNILDALAPRRAALRVVGVNSQVVAADNFRCDAAYRVPATADETAFLARLREILRAERPDLVLAGRDADLVPLAIVKTEPEFAGTLFLSPAGEAVTAVNDKYATWKLAQRHSLPFAETALDAAELERLLARTGFPLICKRRYGNASRGVFISRSEAEAEAALAAGGFVFQEYLSRPDNLDALLPERRFGMPLFHNFTEGDHHSAQCLVGADGALLSFFSTVHVMENGKSINVTAIDAPALAQMAAGYARALAGLGYVGPLNFNCKRLGPDRFVPYELNGRFTGASSARALLGYREIDYALDWFLDGRPPPACAATPVPQRMVVRAPGNQTIDLAAAARLEAEGVWRSDHE